MPRQVPRRIDGPLAPSLLAWFFATALVPTLAAEEFRALPLQSRITTVQPQTGIVLWTTNEAVAAAPIQLEFSYLGYDQVIEARGQYDWTAVEKLLDAVSRRGHQVVLRWHDTYVGRPTSVPAYVKALPDYRETVALSEGQRTGFPDWSHAELQQCLLDFFEEFSRKFQGDRRLAFVQVGFGLWSEYHIYDGPMKLGQTFPSLEYQTKFARQLDRCLTDVPWMISVDAAGDHTPFSDNPDLLALKFGLFDDSFNHKRHAEENEPNWRRFGDNRWQASPIGGEFSFFEDRDQKQALSARGPHGIPFEKHAARFHLSFIIGDDQPRFQKTARLLAAGMACGYRFRVTSFRTSATKTQVTLTNEGIAPCYFDAYLAVDGTRSPQSLKGLLPGHTLDVEIAVGGTSPRLTIESDRILPAQRIQFEADLR